MLTEQIHVDAHRRNQGQEKKELFFLVREAKRGRAQGRHDNQLPFEESMSRLLRLEDFVS